MTAPYDTAIPGPMSLRSLRVVSNEAETSDTATITLEGPGGSFLPGQFMMLYAFGVGEAPISISGNPHTPGALVHTIRRVGAVTEALCAAKPGEYLGVRGPYGTSWPIDEVTDDLLIVAGGIGLAPLRPAVIEAMAQHGRLANISLVYGARTPDDLLYKDDLLGWMGAPDINVAVTVDRATSDWWGDVGLVTTVLSRVKFRPEQTAALVCGPEVMMRVVARTLRDMGVATDRIWVSVERNMKCAVGFCGHCQFGPDMLCKTGPVLRYDTVAARLTQDEI